MTDSLLFFNDHKTGTNSSQTKQATNKDLKMCATLLVIREIQFKTTRYHYTLSRITLQKQ